MSIQITEPTPEAQSPTANAVALLLACHTRIRRFSVMATQIAHAKHPQREHIEAVRRYFVEALPLHAADEEELFFPRLPAHDHSQNSAEHIEIETLLTQMTLRWDQMLVGEPVTELLSSTAQWVALLTQHLILEERTFIPLAQAVFTPADHQACIAAMHARRR